MVVIADTSPLNYLVPTGYAEVLPLYGQVAIPHAVLQDAAAVSGLLDLRSALQTLRATNLYVSSGILSRLLEKDVLRRKLRDLT